jgi:hypothetical protein
MSNAGEAEGQAPMDSGVLNLGTGLTRLPDFAKRLPRALRRNPEHPVNPDNHVLKHQLRSSNTSPTPRGRANFFSLVVHQFANNRALARFNHPPAGQGTLSGRKLARSRSSRTRPKERQQQSDTELRISPTSSNLLQCSYVRRVSCSIVFIDVASAQVPNNGMNESSLAGA